MDSPTLFLAFGAVMLIAALLGVAIDWFGKPLRHRRFVPKVYRFPDERQPRHSQVRRTEWSDASLVLPVVESPPELIRYPDPAAASVAPPMPALADVGPPTAQVPVVDLDVDMEAAGATLDAEPLSPALEGLVTLEDLQDDEGELDDDHVVEPEPTEDEPADARGTGWHTGQYVFNLTGEGSAPSSTTIRTRYWKNVAATPGASVFGSTNMERMRTGKAPQRLNHRSGKKETMRLTGMDFDAGSTPVPTWPSTELDPFA